MRTTPRTPRHAEDCGNNLCARGPCLRSIKISCASPAPSCPGGRQGKGSSSNGSEQAKPGLFRSGAPCMSQTVRRNPMRRKLLPLSVAIALSAGAAGTVLGDDGGNGDSVGFVGHGTREAYAAVSLDDGITWKKTNLSESADRVVLRRRQRDITDGLCRRSRTTAYPGDVINMFHAIAGNKVVVAWPSRYLRAGPAELLARRVREDSCQMARRAPSRTTSASTSVRPSPGRPVPARHVRRQRQPGLRRLRRDDKWEQNYGGRRGPLRLRVDRPRRAGPRRRPAHRGRPSRASCAGSTPSG
jgi:hypothetical protein